MAGPFWAIYNNQTATSYDELTIEQCREVLRFESREQLSHWFAWQQGMPSWQSVLEIAAFSTEHKPPAKPSFRPNRKPTNPPTKASGHLKPVEPPVEIKPVPTRQDDSGQLAFDFGDVQQSVAMSEIYWMSESDELIKANIDDLSPKSPGLAASLSASNALPAGKSPATAVEAISTAQEAAPPTDSESTKNDYRDRRKYERYNVRLAVIIQNENLHFRTYTKNISLGGFALEAPVPSVFFGSDCHMLVTETTTGEKAQFIGRLLTHRETARYISFFRASPDNIVKMQNWIARYVSQQKAG